jgi:hypothetical protein
MKRALRFFFPLVLLAVTGWMAWDNVFSDIAPVRAQAEQVACEIKKCSESHGMTKLDRSMIAQTFDFRWSEATDGLVRVECHRESYVYGPRQCAVVTR